MFSGGSVVYIMAVLNFTTNLPSKISKGGNKITQPLYLRARKNKRAKRAQSTGGEGCEGGICKRSFYLDPLPTQSSLSFCAGVQVSLDSICTFNDRIETQENKGAVSSRDGARIFLRRGFSTKEWHD